ncbi:hypothetical protein RHGRI_004395 [Rhododendron griersonianum]|uniref:Uncharacterized protein n=1 Tax=Rhododendron griersonianum TaxID=479676 RepID=A0AAV6LAI2_9ERIC|nr:hypothetical protein RHGRI_004395 [Rhododendron griersonianum]
MTISLLLGRYRRHQCVADAHDLVLRPGTPQRNAASLLTGQHRRYHYGGGTNPRNVPDVDNSLGRIVPDVDDLVGRGFCHLPNVDDLIGRRATPPRSDSLGRIVPDVDDLVGRGFYHFPDVDDLIGRRATPPRSDPEIHTTIFRCGRVEHSLIGKAASCVRGSLVRLTFHQDRRILTVLAGAIIRSDGVKAKNTNSWLSQYFLVDGEYSDIKYWWISVFLVLAMVDVKILATQKSYKGVLLDVDFCSNIAFVKIASSQPLPHAIFGKLDDLLLGDLVVTVSCSKELGRSDRMRLTDGVRDEIHFRDVSLESPKPNYVEGYVSLVAHEEENPEPHNARTSGLIIKAKSNILSKVILKLREKRLRLVWKRWLNMIWTHVPRLEMERASKASSGSGSSPATSTRICTYVSRHTFTADAKDNFTNYQSPEKASTLNPVHVALHLWLTKM